jgi:hypothetical protein
MHRLIVTGTLMLLSCSPLAFAVDMDAPTTKRITVRSELQRGDEAAFNCALRGKGHEWIYRNRYLDCIDRAASKEKQGNTDTEAFLAGLYWRSGQMFLVIKPNKFSTIEMGEDDKKLYTQVVALYRSELQTLEKSLDLTDLEICDAVAENACSKKSVK